MTARILSQRLLQLIKTAGFGGVMRFIALAIVVVVIAVAASHLRRKEMPADNVARAAPDPLSAELKRCRAVTPDQLALDETCHRVWAENRRRFLAPGKPAEVR